jgi:flagellar motility protein MotE (MotC chaperone)
MIRLLSDFRIVPVVLIAAICLFTLKTFGILFEGGYTLNDNAVRDADDITGAVGKSGRADAWLDDTLQAPVKAKAAPKPPQKQSWAQQMFNYPDVTGSVGETKAPPPDAAAKGKAPAAKPADPPATEAGRVVPLERQPSPAERAILERLQERRTELDERARELDMRENLLRAAEKRLEGRITELKELETRVNTAIQAKNDEEATRFKNLVTMYDNMKAKDAAKIFDRLDMRVLVEVATQINPRRMSDILAQMSPDAAERLTLELATRAKDRGGPDLPKIEGKPVTP